jgi:L-ribulose-5-phosphate 3-epimerase
MMSLRYAYITNGLGDHRIDDALQMLADNGYAGVGLTLDHHHLDPFAPDVAARVAHIAERLRTLNLAVVIETGGRFVLDPRAKHEPTMLSATEEGRARRVDLLCRGVAIAADLGAEALSFWSGRALADTPDDVAWQRLVDGCSHVLDAAERADVQLSFEPEPGMFLQYAGEWERLATQLDNSRFGLTLDLGHCLAIEDESVEACIRRYGDRLRQVQIEDMRRGVHEHLDFGDGEMDFPPALRALRDVNYTGLVSVELSRHSHTAHTTVPLSIEFLQRAEEEGMKA